MDEREVEERQIERVREEDKIGKEEETEAERGGEQQERGQGGGKERGESERELVFVGICVHVIVYRFVSLVCV